jgi:DNA-binding transcriptional regulator YiaG
VLLRQFAARFAFSLATLRQWECGDREASGATYRYPLLI